MILFLRYYININVLYLTIVHTNLKNIYLYLNFLNFIFVFYFKKTWGFCYCNAQNINFTLTVHNNDESHAVHYAIVYTNMSYTNTKNKLFVFKFSEV